MLFRKINVIKCAPIELNEISKFIGKNEKICCNSRYVTTTYKSIKRIIQTLICQLVLALEARPLVLSWYQVHSHIIKKKIVKIAISVKNI